MIHRQKIRQPTKIINIFYDFSVNSMVTFAEMEQAGNVIAQTITALELSSIKVNLEVGCGVTEYGESSYFGLTLKKASQKLDLLRLTFPLQSPAMLRKIGFGIIEILPTKYSLAGGYGTPINSSEDSQQIFEREYYPTIGFKKDNSYYLDIKKIRASNFDYKKLLETMK